MLAAGLRGIERGYQLGPRTDGRDGARGCPSDLREATDLFEASELARETLGDTLVDLVVRNKRAEWDAYQPDVTRLGAPALPAPAVSHGRGLDLPASGRRRRALATPRACSPSSASRRAG